MANPQNLTDWIAYFKAHGVSTDPKNGFQATLDFQDYVGRRPLADTVAEVVAASNANDYFLRDACWAMCAALDPEVAGQVIQEAMLQTKLVFIEKELRRQQDDFLKQARIELEDRYLQDIQRAEDQRRTQKERFERLRKDLVASETEREQLRDQLRHVREAVAILRGV